MTIKFVPFMATIITLILIVGGIFAWLVISDSQSTASAAAAQVQAREDGLTGAEQDLVTAYDKSSGAKQADIQVRLCGLLEHMGASTSELASAQRRMCS
jgi:hypothetical protein